MRLRCQCARTHARMQAENLDHAEFNAAVKSALLSLLGTAQPHHSRVRRAALGRLQWLLLLVRAGDWLEPKLLDFLATSDLDAQHVAKTMVEFKIRSSVRLARHNIRVSVAFRIATRGVERCIRYHPCPVARCKAWR